MSDLLEGDAQGNCMWLLTELDPLRVVQVLPSICARAQMIFQATRRVQFFFD